MTDALLLGESANTAHRPSIAAHWCWDLALRLGAFNSGAGRKRLEGLGLWLPRRANLLPPGTGWDRAEAARRWAEFRHRFPPVVVLCGARLGRLAGVRLLTRTEEEGVTWLCVPHPSGRCRLWNDRSTWSTITALATGLSLDP